MMTFSTYIETDTEIQLRGSNKDTDTDILVLLVSRHSGASVVVALDKFALGTETVE